MSKTAIYIISILSLCVAFALGYDQARSGVQIDCTKLNQTVINGQHILCRPYNPNPKEVM